MPVEVRAAAADVVASDGIEMLSHLSGLGWEQSHKATADEEAKGKRRG